MSAAADDSAGHSRPTFAVILPAWGSGTRFGSDKLLAMLDGKSVLQRSVEAFATRPDVSHAIVASRHRVPVKNDKIRYCEGGDCRAATVLVALRALPESAERVAVHDAARPLVSDNLIDSVFAAAVDYAAVAPAVPLTGTVKRADRQLPAAVRATLDRSELWGLQTPQVCRRADLVYALEQCPLPLEQITDDLQALELSGITAWLIDGDAENLKLTTPLDLKLARLILEARRVNQKPTV